MKQEKSCHLLRRWKAERTSELKKEKDQKIEIENAIITESNLREKTSRAKFLILIFWNCYFWIQKFFSTFNTESELK